MRDDFGKAVLAFVKRFELFPWRIRDFDQSCGFCQDITTGPASGSPPIGCVALPQPLSNNSLTAATREASLAAGWFIIPTRVLIAASVCALAKDLISVGVLDIYLVSVRGHQAGGTNNYRRANAASTSLADMLSRVVHAAYLPVLERSFLPLLRRRFHAKNCPPPIDCQAMACRWSPIFASWPLCAVIRQQIRQTFYAPIQNRQRALPLPCQNSGQRGYSCSISPFDI